VAAVAAGTLWRPSAAGAIASGLSEKVRGLMILPMAVQTIVYALGIYRIYVDLDLVGTALGVVLAHAVTGLPMSLLTVSAALSNLDPRLEQAARGWGRSLGQTSPLCDRAQYPARRAVGCDFCFHPFWDELVVVIFNRRRALFTCAPAMWDGINDNPIRSSPLWPRP